MIIITNEDIWYGYSLYVDWIFFFQINAMYWFSKFFFNTFVGAYVDKRIN